MKFFRLFLAVTAAALILLSLLAPDKPRDSEFVGKMMALEFAGSQNDVDKPTGRRTIVRIMALLVPVIISIAVIADFQENAIASRMLDHRGGMASGNMPASFARNPPGFRFSQRRISSQQHGLTVWITTSWRKFSFSLSYVSDQMSLNIFASHAPARATCDFTQIY